jgi:hypothetical protein
MKAFLVLLLLITTVAVATDLTGTWSGSFKPEAGEHDIPQLLTLKQHGDVLTGSAGPNAGEQYPIENGKADGNTATFQVTTGEWKFTYNLTSDQETLKGDLKLESPTDSRSAKVMLKRVKN